MKLTKTEKIEISRRLNKLFQELDDDEIVSHFNSWLESAIKPIVLNRLNKERNEINKEVLKIKKLKEAMQNVIDRMRDVPDLLDPWVR